MSPISQPNRRKLTLLLLECWQREYDKRPYCNFEFDRLMFEERLQRQYYPQEDFTAIVQFLAKRLVASLKIKAISIPTNVSLMEDFVKSLQKLKHIELLLMNLPTKFFQLLAHTATDMKVKQLSLEGTPLNNADIYQLHSFLIKSSTLLKLNVSDCSINQYNFAQLADGINKSTTLTSCNLSHIVGLQLYLDSNKLAHTISSLIWRNRLQELVLENCGFIGHDMEIIAENLYHKQSKLQTLNLSYNMIGCNGAVEFLKAISSSGTLKHFKMNGCSLNAQGGEAVAQYLSSCSSLESFELQRNNIGTDAVNRILLCLKESCQLQKLYLFGNLFGKDTGVILRTLLDLGVVLQENLDITVTYDDTIDGYRVVRWST